MLTKILENNTNLTIYIGLGIHKAINQDLFNLFVSFQIEKIVLFMLEQQGLLASRIIELNKQQDSLQEQPDISRISDLREAYRAVGRDLLKLLLFVEMNAIGLRKILKKFDKRLRYKFTDFYVKTRANHPYSQLQQVFKHVVICLYRDVSSPFCLLFLSIQNPTAYEKFLLIFWLYNYGAWKLYTITGEEI